MLRVALASFLAFLSLALLPAEAHARLQCVAYARQIGEVQLSGNGRDWWGNAAGVYARGARPQAGAVLAFKASGAMPYGHVAVVKKVVDDRHILIDHANWSAPGLIERGVEVVDISPAGDWSQVRVWYGKTRALGLRPSPTFGFIYPGAAPSGTPVTVTASAEPALRAANG
ncbi:CHAP domain-containing protein [Novosphingobium huizhouense]|uniref:CHAP domain-containing protein n=1 Tax=Novosphingobium huizhouense TaxID=2866625 RepID=UPI001CD90A3B|nr:CHAP domain-containing protein [Novosphingobium huizhouense]